MCKEVLLQKALKLANSAENEPDPIIQEIKFLDGILYLILYGHSMENNGSSKRVLLRIYNDIFHSIMGIWSKIYNYHTNFNDEELDEIFDMNNDPKKDNRLLIIWMRCLGFLKFKLCNFQHCHLAAENKISHCADLLVMSGKHEQFFAEIDQIVGPLTFNCTGHKLIQYAHTAIFGMRCELKERNDHSLC